MHIPSRLLSRVSKHGQDMAPPLWKRGSTSTDTQIGIIVGVLIAIFLMGVCAFLWIYRHSVRFSSRPRRRQRRKSTSSKSSKASKTCDAAPAPDTA
ncbi:hypothetical protein CDD81_8140 [Ophiocordyceps australis]|uniref:Uncharacterized protein n=1 Tax=Ophiocordyceps australis TaxID=1399860 RepID=A0A2C5XWI6_9HYPO|nr:hypothetical protein CDD81_8140 [Ophiocordyceps australis]